MGQVVIRNIDDAVLRRHRTRARRKGIPLERQLREVLAESAARDDREEFIRKLDAFRRRFAKRKQKTDSTQLVREARDQR